MHTLKKRLSAVASYSKNNNFFLYRASGGRPYRLRRHEMVERIKTQNPDQHRVCGQKLLMAILCKDFVGKIDETEIELVSQAGPDDSSDLFRPLAIFLS